MIDAIVAFLLAGPPVFDPRPVYWAGLLYLALPASVLTFSLYYPVVRKIGPAKAAYSSVVVPIIAMGFSTWLEHYQWTVADDHRRGAGARRHGRRDEPQQILGCGSRRGLKRCAGMPSTVIRRFVYDEMEQQLWVEFTTGRKYVYSDVPHEVADAFRSAFSKGIYFNTRIRDRISLPRDQSRRGNPFLKPRAHDRAHDPDAHQHDLQEPLDGPALGRRHHLVRL